MASPLDLTLGAPDAPASPSRKEASPRSVRPPKRSPSPPAAAATNPNPPRFPPEKPSPLPGPGHYYPGSQGGGLAPTGPLNEHKRDPHTRHFTFREPNEKDGGGKPEPQPMDPQQYSAFQPAEYWEESAAGPAFFPPPPHQSAPLKPMAADTGFVDLSQKQPPKAGAKAKATKPGMGHSSSEPGIKKKREPKWLTDGNDHSGLKAKAYRLCGLSRELREYAEVCSHPSLFDEKFRYELQQARDKKKGGKTLEVKKFLTRWPSEIELYGDVTTGKFRDTRSSSRPLSAPRSPPPGPAPPPGSPAWLGPPLLQPQPPPRPKTPKDVEATGPRRGSVDRRSQHFSDQQRMSNFAGARGTVGMPSPSEAQGQRKSASASPEESQTISPEPKSPLPPAGTREPEPEQNPPAAAPAEAEAPEEKRESARQYSTELLEQVASVHDGSRESQPPF